MSSPGIKDISLLQKPNQCHIYSHPVLVRRASAVVTDVGRVAVDAEVARRARLRRTAKACGPDVAVLASMHLEATASKGATEAKEPFSGESTL